MCDGTTWEREPPSHSPDALASLNAEERLHLVPRREDHERGHEDEHEERHPEADVGAPRPRSCARIWHGVARVRAGTRARSRAGRATGIRRAASAALRAVSAIGRDCNRAVSWSAMVVGGQRPPIEALAEAAARQVAAAEATCGLRSPRSPAAAADALGADARRVRVRRTRTAMLVARAVAPAALGARRRGRGHPRPSSDRFADRARFGGSAARSPRRSAQRRAGRPGPRRRQHRRRGRGRSEAPFDESERCARDARRRAGRARGAHARDPARMRAGVPARSHALELAGEALAAGGDVNRRRPQQARRTIAADATGARGGARCGASRATARLRSLRAAAG